MRELPFTCTLRAAASYRLGEPILVTIEISNTSTGTFQLLNWNTPFEDDVADFLTVQRDGEVIEYDGILISRGDPLAEEYLILTSGGMLTKQVDISLSYPIDLPGNYTATLSVIFADAFEIPGIFKQEPRRRDSFESQSLAPTTGQFQVLAGGPPRQTHGQTERGLEAEQAQTTGGRSLQIAESESVSDLTVPILILPAFIQGTTVSQEASRAAERSAITFAHINAQYYAALCVMQLETAAADSNELYNEWFGAFDETRYDSVKGKYSSIRDAVQINQITYDFTGPKCKLSDIAYTSTETKISLCSLFHREPQFGTNPRFNTLVHEWSHAIAGTTDVKHRYGEANSRILAREQPDTAINNAENYGFFAEAVGAAAGRPINDVNSFGDSTSAAPAACAFKNRLYVFWKSNDPTNRILFAASSDGQTWSGGNTINNINNLGDSTSAAPAACVFGNRLYVFWRSNDPTNRIFFSASSDGQTWPGGNTINNINNLGDSTSAALAACVFGNRLYVFWKSNDPTNRILFAASSDGQTWPGGSTINNVNNLGDSTSSAPAACVFGNRLYVFWKSNDPTNRILFSASSDGQTWPDARTINDLPESTSAAPAACIFGKLLCVFWKSNDPTNRLLFSTSTDGETWPVGNSINKVPGLNERTQDAPAAGTLLGKLCVFWKSSESLNRVFFLSNF